MCVTDDLTYDSYPLAEGALAGQQLGRLTTEERAAIEAYALNGYVLINQAMRGEIEMTPVLAQRIERIRSGLRRYPLPTAVRVTSESEAARRQRSLVSQGDAAYQGTVVEDAQ